MYGNFIFEKTTLERSPNKTISAMLNSINIFLSRHEKRYLCFFNRSHQLIAVWISIQGDIHSHKNILEKNIENNKV